LGDDKQSFGNDSMMETSNLPHRRLMQDAAGLEHGGAADEQWMRAIRAKAGGNCITEVRDWVKVVL
jgi:hypothetical protein